MMKRLVRFLHAPLFRWLDGSLALRFREHRDEWYRADEKRFAAWREALVDEIGLQFERAISKVSDDFRTQFQAAHEAKRDAVRIDARVRRRLDSFMESGVAEPLGEDGGEGEELVQLPHEGEEAVPAVQRPPWKPPEEVTP